MGLTISGGSETSTTEGWSAFGSIRDGKVLDAELQLFSECEDL